MRVGRIDAPCRELFACVFGNDIHEKYVKACSQYDAHFYDFWVVRLTHYAKQVVTYTVFFVVRHHQSIVLHFMVTVHSSPCSQWKGCTSNLNILSTSSAGCKGLLVRLVSSKRIRFFTLFSHRSKDSQPPNMEKVFAIVSTHCTCPDPRNTWHCAKSSLGILKFFRKSSLPSSSVSGGEKSFVIPSMWESTS